MEFLGLPWGEEEERVIMDRKKSWSLDGLLSNSVLPLTNLPRESGQSRLETGAASTSPGPGRAALWGLRCVWQGPSPCLEPRLSSFPLPCLSPFTSFCLVSPSLPRPPPQTPETLKKSPNLGPCSPPAGLFVDFLGLLPCSALGLGAATASPIRLLRCGLQCPEGTQI